MLFLRYAEKIIIMVDPAVSDYVRKKLERGASIEEIKHFLLAEGWKKREVEEAIDFVLAEKRSHAFKEEVQKQEIFNPKIQQKSIIGTTLSLIAGLLIINSLFSESGLIMDIQNSVIYYFSIMGIVGDVLALVNLILGIVIFLGGFLIYKGHGGKGGLLVLIVSIFLFLINGFIIGVLIGILGGIFGISKR